MTQFQGHAILWYWTSHKRYDIETQFQWNTNRDLHTPYSTVSCRMILSDLVKYLMTPSVARSLRQLSFFFVIVLKLRYEKCQVYLSLSDLCKLAVVIQRYFFQRATVIAKPSISDFPLPTRFATQSGLCNVGRQLHCWIPNEQFSIHAWIW